MWPSKCLKEFSKVIFNVSSTHGSSVRLSCPHSYWRCRIFLRVADKHGRFGSGMPWWEDTGTSLRGKQEKDVQRKEAQCRKKNRSITQRMKSENSRRCLWFMTLHSLHSSGFSSELSPQSSSPSHFQASGLHRVLLHWNSSWGHWRSAEKKGGKTLLHLILLCLWLKHLTSGILKCVLKHTASTDQFCHNSPHHFHPCNQGQRHTSSGREYSDRSYTGNGHCHTSAHNHAEKKPTAHRRPNIIMMNGTFRSSKWTLAWKSVCTSSDPSAQSWSPSHFHLPAIQRPFVQANSLSEHCRGPKEEEKTLL